ncbi:MAG: hypothetical protein KME42_04620 [Tildeniella nuda ZEHNDER 1965/U140]|nr:hypothetical protein [Tildeniella nuda ZEHNDER 1965/U140]
MTSQKDQIQALITDIDGVLQKTTPRLPWVVSGEMTQQRQVLERVRNYLVTFQRSVGESVGQGGARPDLLAHDIYYQPQASYSSPPVDAQAERSQPYSPDELTAQQMLQAIVQEMGYLRSNLMQPLQSDVELLRQQRESLAQEIRQLEAQRQGYAGQLPSNQQQVITEFLQALMSRLQETLPQQVAQTLRSGNQQSLPYGANLALTGSAPSIAATSESPSQGSGNIQIAQSQSDELLTKLDSTLSVVFESLQRNVQAYEESLSQGLDKMHSLGQQGEMMFTALISHLANQLGHEASSYLQSPAATGLESARLASPQVAPTVPDRSQPSQLTVAGANSSLFEQPNATAVSRPLTLPFPGTEISSRFSEAVPASAANLPEPSVDTAIDSWLRSASGVDATPAVDFELAELNLEGFDLNQLAAQDVNALLELDANLLGTNLSPQPILAPIEPIDSPPQPIANEMSSGAMSAEDTADIDAALKLLEQLSSELQDQPASVADADAQIDRMLSTPSSLAEETAAASIPDDAQDELDEFYESLFGNNAIAVEPSLEPAVTDSLDSAPAIAAVDPTSTSAPVTSPLTAQPIDTLPAETQALTETLVAPDTVAAPAVSTAVDPTLGWDLLAKPSSTQATELDIPAALLEDELLSGWDFEETEVGLTEPEPIPVSDELLDTWDADAASDRAPFVADTLTQPPIDTTATVSSDSQDSATAINADVLVSDTAPTLEPPGSTDEIAALTDLFDEPMPAEPLEAPIANPVVPPQSFSQSPVEASPNTIAPTLPESTPKLADQVENRLGDDRYTPASPEEDLLPLADPADELDSELWLDESTLNRLSEDLFSLEETISEPSILSYDVEPGADTATLYSEATAPYETAPYADEPIALEDWSTSLNELADNVPTTDSTPDSTESERTAIVAEEPSAFILEGMDDLFTNTPIVLPVTPIPPPIVSTQAEPSAAFTLEGMDDLFGDSQTDPVPLPPTSFPIATQPPFTLEGIDDLFSDAPIVSSAPLTPSSDAPSDQSLPFTLEGVDELFADALPIADVPPVPPETVDVGLLTQPGTAADFTLDTAGDPGDLFVAAPTAVPSPESASTEAIAPPASPSPSLTSESTADFTLDTAGDPGDLFVAAPTAVPLPESVSTEAIALPSSSLPNPASTPVAPFTFEQVGDLFIEVPSGELPFHEQPTNELPGADFLIAEPSAPVPEPLVPFTLEQVGDVFMEVPSEEAIPDALAASPNPQPSSPPPAEPSTLEQAFASLMGSFGDPMSADDGTDAQDAEKKK